MIRREAPKRNERADTMSEKEKTLISSKGKQGPFRSILRREPPADRRRFKESNEREQQSA